MRLGIRQIRAGISKKLALQSLRNAVPYEEDLLAPVHTIRRSCFIRTGATCTTQWTRYTNAPFSTTSKHSV